MEILKHLNTSDDYTKLSDMLFYSIVNMTPISNNAMLDGFNIGLFIDLKKIIIPIIRIKNMGVNYAMVLFKRLKLVWVG